MSLGIALLGTGDIAQRAFTTAVQAVEGARLVAVLSRDKAPALSVPSSMASLRSMMASLACCGALRWTR